MQTQRFRSRVRQTGLVPLEVTPRRGRAARQSIARVAAPLAARRARHPLGVAEREVVVARRLGDRDALGERGREVTVRAEVALGRVRAAGQQAAVALGPRRPRHAHDRLRRDAVARGAAVQGHVRDRRAAEFRQLAEREGRLVGDEGLLRLVVGGAEDFHHRHRPQRHGQAQLNVGRGRQPWRHRRRELGTVVKRSRAHARQRVGHRRLRRLRHEPPRHGRAGNGSAGPRAAVGIREAALDRPGLLVEIRPRLPEARPAVARGRDAVPRRAPFVDEAPALRLPVGVVAARGPRHLLARPRSGRRGAPLLHARARRAAPLGVLLGAGLDGLVDLPPLGGGRHRLRAVVERLAQVLAVLRAAAGHRAVNLERHARRERRGGVVAVQAVAHLLALRRRVVLARRGQVLALVQDFVERRLAAARGRRAFFPLPALAVLRAELHVRGHGAGRRVQRQLARAVGEVGAVQGVAHGLRQRRERRRVVLQPARGAGLPAVAAGRLREPRARARLGHALHEHRGAACRHESVRSTHYATVRHPVP